MMKINKLALALAALAFIACTEETPEDPKKPDNPEPGPEPETPVALSLTAYAPEVFSSKVLWQPGDEILVFTDDGKSQVFKSTLSQPAEVAEFKADEPDSGFADSFSGGGAVKAIFPASNGIRLSGDAFNIPWTINQKVLPGSSAANDIVAFAGSTSKELHFKSVTGGIRFSLAQEGIEKVVFDGLNASNYTGGQLSIYSDSGDCLPDNFNPATITLTPDGGGQFAPGEWYYLTLAPCTVSSPLSISFYKDGTSSTVSLDKTLQIKSGVLESLAEIDKDLTVSDRGTKDILMDFYYALDGPNWKKQENWGSDADISEWEGIGVRSDGSIVMNIYSCGLKGEIPECIGELGELMYEFSISNEPGVTGALPESFGNFSKMRRLSLYNTSITSIPDIFRKLPALNNIAIYYNENLTGPLYESIGEMTNITRLTMNSNRFSGSVPASYARFGANINLNQNCLSGKLDQAFFDSPARREMLYNILFQRTGYGFDTSDQDLPGYAKAWKDGPISDLDGNVFNIANVVRNSKYTVYLFWAPWCPFSKVLVPQLRDYYKQYSQDGLEVIATVQSSEPVNGSAGLWDDLAGQKKEVTEKGYDLWYNFYWKDYFSFMFTNTPNAEVYDSDGNVLFSSISDFDDPVRHRFSKTASSDLIPFLETLLGPAEVPDSYTSSDYSKDGQVLTLQKASVGKGINIVFLGDAYTDKDMKTNGVYETVMKQAMEEFFAREPYKTFRNRFNVYAVKVVSPNGRIGDGYTTALKTKFYSGTSVGGNDSKCFEYALKVPGINSRNNLLVSVIINTRRHAGTAYMSESGQYSVVYSPSYGGEYDLMGSTLRHEAGGHGFAFLADEYYTSQGTAPQTHIDSYNQSYNKYGWFSNVDFTDDPSKIRWSAFLSDSRYTGQVGIYEGGGLYAFGVFRPSKDSIMNEQVEDTFNAPSRWAIYKRIMELSGESYSFESFLEYDAVNRKAASSAPAKRSSGIGPRRYLEHTAPPVILP